MTPEKDSEGHKNGVSTTTGSNEFKKIKISDNQFLVRQEKVSLDNSNDQLAAFISSQYDTKKYEVEIYRASYVKLVPKPVGTENKENHENPQPEVTSVETDSEKGSVIEEIDNGFEIEDIGTDDEKHKG